jgi:hypothetical protein
LLTSPALILLFDADPGPDSESETELDLERDDLEQPVLLRRPRYLRTKNRQINSLEAAMLPENYYPLPPLDPGLHST